MTLLQKAFRLAKEVRLRAHAPYSKFLVGAAIKMKDSDMIFAGCNVENASYGGAICAERNAICQMVAALGDQAKPDFVVVVTDTKEGVTPCGFCRQVLIEFCDPDLPVHIANLEGIQRKYLLKELLPHNFDKSDLT